MSGFNHEELASVGLIFTSWRNFILYLVSNRNSLHLNALQGLFRLIFKGEIL
jgi:hypothetical protein